MFKKIFNPYTLSFAAGALTGVILHTASSYIYSRYKTSFTSQNTTNQIAKIIRV